MIGVALQRWLLLFIYYYDFRHASSIIPALAIRLMILFWLCHASQYTYTHYNNSYWSLWSCQRKKYTIHHYRYLRSLIGYLIIFTGYSRMKSVLLMFIGDAITHSTSWSSSHAGFSPPGHARNYWRRYHIALNIGYATGNVRLST